MTGSGARVWALSARTFKRTLIKASQAQIKERVSQLSSVALLSVLSQSDLKRAASVMHKASFAAGTAIYNEGEEAEKFYVVTKGTVKLSATEGGDLATIAVDDFFGALELLDNSTRIATALAAEDVETWTLDRKPFESLLPGLKVR